MIEYSVGVDVGADGAVTLMSKALKIIKKWPIPVNKDGSTDVRAYSQIFKAIKKFLVEKNLPYCIYIEEVHAIFMASASSTFAFGMMSMLPEAVCSTLGLSFVRVQPKAWQKVSWSGIVPIRKAATKKKKAGSIDTKATSEIAAKRLFPNEDFKRTKRCKTNHDGMIDSTLIAYYGLRINWSKDGF